METLKILSDMLRQIVLVTTFTLVFIGCNSHSATTVAKDSLTNHPADTGQQKIADNPGTLTIGNLDGDLNQDTIFSRVLRT